MANKIGIVIGVDGEREFAQAMKNAQTSAKNVDQELKGLKSEYKDNASSLEALIKKQEALAKQTQAYDRVLAAAKAGQANAKKGYQEMRQSLEKLESQLKQSKTALEGMSKTDPGYDKQAKEVAEYEKAVDQQRLAVLKADNVLTQWEGKVNRAETAVKQNSEAVEQNKKYLDEAANSSDKCAHSMDKLGDEAKEAGEKSKTLGDSLKTALAVAAGNLAADALREVKDAAVEAAKYVVDVGSTFEASMSKVESLSGASGSELESLSEKAQTLGRTTKFSASEAADAMSNMALAGWNTNQMLTGIDGVLQLAAAADMDLATASDVVAGNLAAFNMEASESSKLADIMAKAQASSKTTADQLAEAYSTSATNLTQYGQQVTTTTALLEGMASVNDTGSAAGTKLSAVMSQITQKMQDGAIAIGETSVQVTDQNGNFRDLIDILADVEKATAGMGNSQKAAALSATFNRTSLSGVNELLSVGSDKLREYQGQLEDSSGAAADMAETMQDNLQGAMTEFGSATEGLGVAIYDKVKGPLTAVVDLDTSAINGLTDALSSKKIGSDVADSVQEIVDSFDSAQQASDDIQASYEEQAAKIDFLVAQYEGLTSKENLNAAEKDRLKQVTEELVGLVPSLNGYYDEQSGKLDTTKTNVKKLTEAYKEQARQQDINKASEQLYDTWVDAQVQLALEKDKMDQLKKEGDLYLELSQKAQEYSYKVNDSATREAYLSDMTAILEKAKDGTLTFEEYSAALDLINKGWSSSGTAMTEFGSLSAQAYGSLQESTKAYEEASAASDKASKDLEALERATTEAASSADGASDSYNALTDNLPSGDALNDFNDGLETGEKKVLSLDQTAQQLTGNLGQLGEANIVASESARKFAESESEAADSTEDSSEAAEKAAEQLKKCSEIYKESAQTFKENWKELKDEASQTITFSITSKFDGGEDQTTETMNANLQSQLDGYKKYAENLAVLREAMSEGIITPEFLTNLEEQGTDAANIIDHMVWTLQNQDDGVEQVKGISDKYMEALDWQDQISGIIAGDQAAFSEWATSMGSSDIDFSNLKETIANGVQGADETMTEKLNSLVESAQQIGATIPDGLQEGIASGDIEGAQAIEQMQSAIQGQMDALTETVQEQGGTVGEETTQAIADGIANGDTGAITSAFNGLLAELSGTVADVGFAKEAGSQIVDKAAEGVAENTALNDSMTTIVQQAQQTIEASASGMQSAGKTISAQLAAGVASGGSGVKAAMNAVMTGAKSAASSGATGFSSIGQNISHGLAAGISSSSGAVSAAAAAAVTNAINAAQAAGDIHSPSRKARDLVGKQISAGVAFGIKLKAKDAANEAAAMVSSALKKASDVAKSYNAEDAAYIVGSMTNKAISSNFGVSATKTTGSGKKKKTTKKDSATYNSDILSAAETYYSNLNILQEQSAADEVQYWTAVRKQLTAGTQAWYNATEKINSAQSKIGNFSIASSVLDSYTDFYDISEKAEEEYWDKVRRQYKTGTEDRLQADKQYYDAHKKYLEKIADINEEYAKKIDEKNAEYTDAVKDRAKTLVDAFGLFDEFISESQTGEELLFNMQSQAAGYEDWAETFSALSNRGILSDDLLSALGENGPSDSAAIHALMELSNDQLKQYQEAYDKKIALSQKQAEKDNAGLKASVEKEVADLKAEQQKELASVNTSLSESNKTLANIAASVKTITEERAASAAAGFAGSSVGTQTDSSATKSATPAAAATSTAPAKATDKILEAIQSGKKRSKKLSAKDKKDHVALWEYIVQKYGYAPSESIYKKLASALGVKVSNKVTSAQKNSILKALKKKGYAGGTKRTWEDEFAMINELGDELAIRNAGDLTYLTKGSAVVPHNLSENLFSWGAINPAQLNQMVANSVLNASLAAGYKIGNAPAGYNDSALLSELSGLRSDIKSLQLRMDGHDLVVGLSDDISTNLAARARRRR